MVQVEFKLSQAGSEIVWRLTYQKQWKAKGKQSGTIETLERQLVQAGIKDKVNKAEVEIAKQKSQVDTDTKKEFLETQAKQKLAQKVVMDEANQQKERIKMEADNIIKNLQSNTEKN